MLIIKNKRYIKRYRVGGSGMFDALTKLISNANTTKTLASHLSRAATSDLGKTAISAGKTAARELATAAISAAKDAAVEKGKQLISKKRRTGLTQKNKDILDGLATNVGGAIRIQDLVRRSNGEGLRLAPF